MQREVLFVACDLDKTKLPTERDVMQYLMFLRSAERKVSYSGVFKPALKAIAELWNQAGIPIVVSGSLYKKLASTVERHRSVAKTPSKYVAKDRNELFMICRCECGIELKCRCYCNPDKQIPIDERDFYIDQCGPRLLTIDSYRDAQGDGENADVVMDDISASGIVQSSTSAGYFPTEGEFKDFERSQREINPPSDDEDEEQRLNITSATLTCLALDRAGISDRMAALLATCLLKDLGVTGFIIDRNKGIERKRESLLVKHKHAMICSKAFPSMER